MYFSTTASYSSSDRYAVKDPQDCKRMFLTEVITGSSCLGEKDMKHLPQVKGTTFNSAVNDLSKPSIFVVFRDASAYPLYLLTYK